MSKEQELAAKIVEHGLGKANELYADLFTKNRTEFFELVEVIGVVEDDLKPVTLDPKDVLTARKVITLLFLMDDVAMHQDIEETGGEIPT